MAKKTPEKKSMIHAASVNHKPVPMEAVPPTAPTRALIMKKNTTSKINARSTTVAAKPAMQEEQQVIAISRTCASSPNTEDIAAKPRPTICRTSTYVIHLTTTCGISMFAGKFRLRRAFGSASKSVYDPNISTSNGDGDEALNWGDCLKQLAMQLRRQE
jgi:hypothetical protein